MKFSVLYLRTTSLSFCLHLASKIWLSIVLTCAAKNMCVVHAADIYGLSGGKLVMVFYWINESFLQVDDFQHIKLYRYNFCCYLLEVLSLKAYQLLIRYVLQKFK